MSAKTKLTGIVVLVGVVLTILTFGVSSQTQPNQTMNFKEVEFNSNDRILILAPHPDDEILGCGGIIQKANKMNLPLKIVFLTYGDQNQWSFIIYRKRPIIMPKSIRLMGLVRHDEAIEAAKVLGIPPDELIFLGYPDFRTLAIWDSHWGNSLPARSILTDVRAVPYKNAFRPGAPYKADEILKDLKTIIQEFKPTKIFVSHPADYNPDHQSLYLFTRVALWDLKNDVNPEIYPYLLHFKKWPKLSGYQPNGELVPPDILAQKIDWENIPLENSEVTSNYNAIKKHRSQYQINRKYLLSFICSNELFGDFPIIDLKKEKIPAIPLESNRQEFLQQLPEELVDEEKAAFVGLEKETLSLENDTLVYSLALSRPLGETVGLSLFVFGYSQNTPFSEMPKLHIKFGALEHKIFDQNHSLPLDSIQIERLTKQINLRIPLQLIGNPDRILTSSRTYLADVPLDWTSWRIVEIR